MGDILDQRGSHLTYEIQYNRYFTPHVIFIFDKNIYGFYNCLIEIPWISLFKIGKMCQKTHAMSFNIKFSQILLLYFRSLSLTLTKRRKSLGTRDCGDALNAKSQKNNRRNILPYLNI